MPAAVAEQLLSAEGTHLTCMDSVSAQHHDEGGMTVLRNKKRSTLSPSRGTVLVTEIRYGASFSRSGSYCITSEKQMSSGFTYLRASLGTHLHFKAFNKTSCMMRVY